MAVEVSYALSARQIGVRLNSSFRVGEPAPPPIGELSVVIAVVGDIFHWANLVDPSVDRGLYLALREAREGSLDVILESVASSTGFVVASLAGELPTAVANFMACLDALKKAKFLASNYFEQQKHKGREEEFNDLNQMVHLLERGVSRVGSIEIRTEKKTIIIKDIDFDPSFKAW